MVSPLVQMFHRTHSHTQILEVTKPFLLTKNDAQKLGQVFAQEMDLGLSSCEADRKKTCLQQEVTFVTRLPDGSEKGDFLSLDLGSTNFRVLLSTLKNGSDDEFFVKYYDVPAEIRTGSSVRVILDSLQLGIKISFVPNFHPLAI